MRPEVKLMEEEDLSILAPQIQGGWAVLARGLKESPELRTGLAYTIALALVGAIGALVVPILVQQVLDRGFSGPNGFRPTFVFGVCAIAGVGVVTVYLAGKAVYRRMVTASEMALASLRVRTFAQVHRLSIAAQNAQKRGTFVSRVTADIDTLAHFMEWGAISWITGTTLALGTLIVMLFYSWQLTIVVVISIIPLFFVLRNLQKGLSVAYDRVRTRVGELLSEVSESIMGAAVIRAYGLDDRMDRRLKKAIRNQYDAQIESNRYMSTIFPVGDFFGSIALAAVVAIGVWQGPGWGMTSGQLVAFAFLTSILVQPLAELSETFDMTQTAIAGWRKVIAVLDTEVDVIEPVDGLTLPAGALSVDAQGVSFQYRDGDTAVLQGIDVSIPEGARIAVVGETGCGKSTFAKLLCRLADPTEGRILIAGSNMREIAPESRRERIRMVPQDGFLFDATIRENVAQGRIGATDDEVDAAFADLHLTGWVQRLNDGLDTRVGERGSSLSVGEAQLVALARAHIADPGLLILDEATSAVDPETERSLVDALEVVSHGRTTVTVAHRLSTAEAADEVLVFDAGRIVERGAHAALLALGGIYAGLYDSWLGNTRAL